VPDASSSGVFYGCGGKLCSQQLSGIDEASEMDGLWNRFRFRKFQATEVLVVVL
jgi:hypothetical protein